MLPLQQPQFLRPVNPQRTRRSDRDNEHAHRKAFLLFTIPDTSALSNLVHTPPTRKTGLALSHNFIKHNQGKS